MSEELVTYVDYQKSESRAGLYIRSAGHGTNSYHVYDRNLPHEENSTGHEVVVFGVTYEQAKSFVETGEF